jgi:hypothetical protein
MRTSANTSTPRSSANEIDFAEPAAPVALDEQQSRAPHQLGHIGLPLARPARFMAGLTALSVHRFTPMSGILFVVATPIGNLADASARIAEVLRSADLVACEDTRTTRTLLARYGIDEPTVALHQHNERAASDKLLQLLMEGKNLALVSDAGTPALSDPGALLVEGAHRAGIQVSPVPAPSAAAAAFPRAASPPTAICSPASCPLPARPRERRSRRWSSLSADRVRSAAPHPRDGPGSRRAASVPSARSRSRASSPRSSRR